MRARVARATGVGIGVATAAVSAFAACAGGRGPFSLPAPVSGPTAPVPTPRAQAPAPRAQALDGGLRVGFGRVDFTPPPGVPLAGNGFEGAQADGYRQRLYARAAFFDDGAGERLAVVVADLPHLSLLLHRRAAAALPPHLGIGADRLLIAVTHTHAGPGNHYEAGQYNEQASALPGFDETLTDSLVAALSRAVVLAAADLAPAVAAWGETEIRGVTRNRSLAPYLANPGTGGATPASAVDDTLRMLRIDRCGEGWRDCRPKGAFSLFAIHGTVLPPANTVFDGDVHGVVERHVEHHIETSDPSLGRAFRSAAFHLLANASEGDVSPAYSPESRCGDFRRFRPGAPPAGPRAPEPRERWTIAPEALEACLAAARRDADSLGAVIGTAAARLFDEIGASGRLTAQVRLGRAFRTVDLVATPGLCPPRSGVSTFGGAEDARTRLFEWRPLGLEVGMREGGAAAHRTDRGCHGRKKIGLGFIQGIAVGRLGLPTHAQLAVYRIGDALLAATPGEVTTAAGLAMRRAVAAEGPDGVRTVGLVGLANGYLQYVTTAEEYALQHYEGGSTLYGPATARVFADHLADLAAALRDGRDVAEVDSVLVEPGPRRSYVPPGDQGPAPAALRRAVVASTCEAGMFEARWIDLHPGRFRPSAAQVLEIESRRTDGRWDPVARDDAPDVVVRAVRSLGARGYLWHVAWSPGGGAPPGTYRLRLPARLGMPALPASEEHAVTCGS